KPGAGDIVREVLEAFDGPNLVEPLVHLVAAKQALPAHWRQDVREVHDPAGRHALATQASAEDLQAIVDVLHALGPWIRAALVVAQDPPVLVDDVALVPSAVVAKHGHGGHTASARCLPDGCDVDRQIGIAVEHEEAVVQAPAVGRLADRTGGAAQGGALVRIGDREAERGAVAGKCPDEIGPVAYGKQDAPDALPRQPGELVGKERLAVDWEQGFRQVPTHRAHARAQPAREDQHLHQAPDPMLRYFLTMTVEPSKSNLKRTSSMPSSAIAARTPCGSAA